jgi:hypothetical protein
VGVLTDLVVAPLADAAAVAKTALKERTWPWADAKGLGVDDLATMHCLLDGRDPDEPVAPPEWHYNPFTKQRMVVRPSAITSAHSSSLQTRRRWRYSVYPPHSWSSSRALVRPERRTLLVDGALRSHQSATVTAGRCGSSQRMSPARTSRA